MKIENTWFWFIILFQNLNRKSMFAVLHSDISSLKSGLLHLIGQPYCKKGRSAKVKGGIRNLILTNYLIDPYTNRNNHRVHACWAPHPMLLVIFTTVNYGRKFFTACAQIADLEPGGCQSKRRAEFPRVLVKSEAPSIQE
jgi:hypothetical protein